MIRNRAAVLGIALLVITGLSGCRSAYYAVWDRLGWAKRDILVDRVKDVREDQEAAKKQFKSALEKFQELTHFQGGDLEATYKKLDKEYQACEERAEEVRTRIGKVDTVAQDLFREWQKELGEYDNDELKRDSETKLRETRQRYDQMYTAMKTAESRMDPILKTFKTHVLYLKHNLNAQAIASLQTQVAGIRTDVDRLIQDMEKSIREADAFIGQIK